MKVPTDLLTTARHSILNDQSMDEYAVNMLYLAITKKDHHLAGKALLRTQKEKQIGRS